MCLPIVLKIFGPCRGSQPGFVVVWKPSFSRGENVLSKNCWHQRCIIYMYIYTDVDVYVYDCIVLLLMIYCILHMFVIIMGKQNINTCAKRSSPFLWPSNINAFKIKQSQHIGLVREFLDVAVTSNQWEDFLAERCHIYRSVSMREIDTLILMAKHLLRNQR